ncbi:MAG: hypothetical protein R3B45_14565 [Bdellovibrionota bacterium]
MNTLFKKHTQVITILYILIFAYTQSLSANETANSKDRKSIAILGDSLATGAATHPAMVFDPAVMWNIFNNKTSIKPNSSQKLLKKYQINEDPKPPILLKKNIREYSGALDWLVFNTIQFISERYLNVEQYSWGYLLGRSIGVAPERIYIAAENGARITSISRQMDRVLDYLDGNLPNKIMIFYTGNDLCAPTPELTTSEEDYRNALYAGLNYISTNGNPPIDGAEVSVVGFLGILQLLGQEKILEKQIRAFGKNTTCRKLREQGYLPNLENQSDSTSLSLDMQLFSQIMPPNPARMCPTLFSPPSVVKEHINFLANRIRKYREIAKEVVDEMNKNIAIQDKSNIQFRYIDATEKIYFDPEDIAGDCFHLTVNGQAKIADAVLTDVSKDL